MNVDKYLEMTGKTMSGSYLRIAGTPVWSCKICRLQYQKKSIARVHVLNSHKNRVGVVG